MRLITLKLKNLNSLQGEHEIHFDKHPIASSGLFVIIGPTGAGKSTILDAITLALYNKVPRLNNIDISKNSIGANGYLITHHMTNAYAEVEYETTKGRFRSVWSIGQMKRKGGLSDYHMEVYDVNTGEIVDVKKGAVDKFNEKMIGLSFDQFVKSILLSQGEFAQFLKSKHDERSALLEKITGGEIYKKLGAKAFQKNKEAKDVLDSLQNQMNLLASLTLDDVNLLNTELHSIEIGLVNTNIELIKQNELLNLIQRFNLLNANIELLSKEKDKLSERKRKFETKLQQLYIHEKLNAYRDQLNIYVIKKEDQQSAAHAILTCQDSIAALNTELKKLCLWISSKVNDEVSPDNYAFYFTQLIDEFKQLTTQKNVILDKGKQTKIELLSELKLLSPSVETLINIENPISITQAIDKIKNNTSIAPYINKQDDELNKLLEDIDIKLITIEKATICFNTITKLISKIDEKNSEVIQSTLNQDALKMTLEDEIKFVDILKQKLEIARKDLDFKKSQFNLQEYRETLIDGKPCPLCGSLHHPNAHESLVSIGSLTLELDKIESNYNIHQSLMQQQLKEQAVLDQFIKQSSLEIEALIAENVVQQNLFFTLLNQQYSLDALPQLEYSSTTLSNEKKAIQFSFTARHDLSRLHLIFQKYLMREELLSSYKSIENKIIEKFGKSFSLELLQDNKLQFDALKQELVSQSTLLANSKKQSAEADSLIQNLEEALQSPLLELGFSSINDAVKALLSDSEYKSITSTKNSLNEETVTLDTQLNDRRNELMAISENHILSEYDYETLIRNNQALEENRNQNLQRQGEIKERLANDELNLAKKNALQGEIDVLKNGMRKWELLNTYIGDKEGKKFSSFAQELTMHQIILLANQRLQKLTDRYLIYAENIQEIMVIDLYQGNEKRNVRSLSGGETFLLSLALALSLSDLASQEVKIESLFIDEGFGTLDEESLNTALDTLELLQYETQKTIGIISHVEVIKERISTQIRVIKNANGYSSLEVVG